MRQEELVELLDHFQVEGRLIHWEPFGRGHINKTFALYYAFDHLPTRRYILQEVNTTVFQEPEKLMENICNITSYLRDTVTKRQGDPSREVLNLIPTLEGAYYYRRFDGAFFRIFDFIENATCYQLVTKELFYHSAKALGAFACLLDNFDLSCLHDVIQDFHHTPRRFQAFSQAVAQDKRGRAEGCQKEIAFVQEREEFCHIILREIQAGTILERVCHNDTKLNNIMFDNETHQGICILDLDTIMKGSLLYDFGDSIRFGASTALEDEENLAFVSCDLEKYEAFVRGYLEETREILSPKEFSLLAHSAILLTLECGMRFLTDHLEGDRYFRVRKENHNLIRCRNQLKLVEDMEGKLKQMIAINEKYH